MLWTDVILNAHRARQEIMLVTGTASEADQRLAREVYADDELDARGWYVDTGPYRKNARRPSNTLVMP